MRPQLDGLTWVALGTLSLVATVTLLSGDFLGTSTAIFLAFVLILLTAEKSGRTRLVEGSRLAGYVGFTLMTVGLGFLAAWILLDVSRWYYAVSFWAIAPGGWLIARSRRPSSA